MPFMIAVGIMMDQHLVEIVIKYDRYVENTNTLSCNSHKYCLMDEKI